jgi:hypothetical protein
MDLIPWNVEVKEGDSWFVPAEAEEVGPVVAGLFQDLVERFDHPCS